MASLTQWTWVWANSCLHMKHETVKDRESWYAAEHGITKSRTRLSSWTTATVSPCLLSPASSQRVSTWNSSLYISHYELPVHMWTFVYLQLLCVTSQAGSPTSQHRSCFPRRTILTACLPGDLRKSLFWKQMEADAEVQMWPGPGWMPWGWRPPFLRILHLSCHPDPGILVCLMVLKA